MVCVAINVNMRGVVFCLLLHRQWLVLCLGQETNETTTSSSLWSVRSVSRKLQQCLSGTQRWQCLGDESERLLEAATRDKSTWPLSEYLSIEPMQEEVPTTKARSATGLAGKLLQLAQGRALRVRLPRQLTISNAIDDFGNGLGLDQGTIALIDDKVDKFVAGFGSLTATDNDKQKVKQKQKKKKKNKDKSQKKKKRKKKKKKGKKKKKKKGDKHKKKKKNKSKNCFNKTGRKKKDKDKNMAMMGGMIMLATFAQMFLGKVILIAGSAFIMAKIALLISLLVSKLGGGQQCHAGSLFIAWRYASPCRAV